MSNAQELPRIYLDTNHWIELSRIAKGKNDDPTCKKLYSELLELSNSNEILIPFSSFNFYEIIKINNQQQREEMIDFMVDTSKGWFFKPIDKYLKYEIENACYKKLNSTKYYNIFSSILTNRADSILSGHVGKVVPREGHNPTQEETERIQKIWDEKMKDLNWMKTMFKQEEPRMFVKGDVAFIDKITEKIEKDRDNSFGVSDTTFDKYARVKYIIELLEYDLSKFCQDNNFSFNKLFTNRSEFEDLIENMPALSVYVELSYVRDKESRERPVQRNDFYDIWHFATGLPYANIMVGEKMFGSISKRQKLDQKNECVLFRSLKEMAEFDIREMLEL